MFHGLKKIISIVIGLLCFIDIVWLIRQNNSLKVLKKSTTKMMKNSTSILDEASDMPYNNHILDSDIDMSKENSRYQNYTDNAEKPSFKNENTIESNLKVKIKPKFVEVDEMRQRRSYRGKMNMKNVKLGLPCARFRGKYSPLPPSETNECFNQTIPLRSSFNPIYSNLSNPCMPRIVLLPSIPTSGNSLFQSLFIMSTGFLSLTAYPHDKKDALYQVSYENNNQKASLNLYTHLDRTCFMNAFLPYSNHVVLTKLHFPLQDPNNSKSLPGIHGVIYNEIYPFKQCVHVARNPGDNLLRDATRWQAKSNKFLRNYVNNTRTKAKCDQVLKTSEKYNIFHDYWYHWSRIGSNNIYNKKEKQEKCIVAHYEHLSNPNYTQKVVDKVLSFINEPPNFYLNVKQLVKQPTYQQGSLFAQACGVDYARALHNLTQHVSMKLGYNFDHETGIWHTPFTL